MGSEGAVTVSHPGRSRSFKLSVRYMERDTVYAVWDGVYAENRLSLDG